MVFLMLTKTQHALLYIGLAAEILPWTNTAQTILLKILLLSRRKEKILLFSYFHFLKTFDSQANSCLKPSQIQTQSLATTLIALN